MVAHREDFCGCYDHGRKHGLVHVSPWRQMRGKKYFTWGFHYPEYSDGTVFCDNGAHYVEIQFGPMETQMERAMLAAGQGLAYAETWIPFRATGGFDWADRSLLFNAGADGTWLYAAVPLRVRIAAGGKAIERDLKPAEPTRLGLKINPGAEVELCVNDKLARAFRFPLAGRQEPGGAARAERQYNPKPRGKPTRAPDFLQAAREAALADMWPQAIHYYRKSLELAPRQAQVRLELADALWHIGDFAAGAAELQRLLKGPLSDQAKLKLEQRALVEARFFAPVKALPEGPERDLALAEQFAGYGGNEAAAGIYRRLLRTARNNPRVHYGLAMYWQHACGKRLQGLRHARRALALSGYARDYVIELAPLFLSAHRYRELIGLVRRSAPAVQALSFVRKLLVQAWFELGEFGRCQAIFAAPEPIYSWEGEMGMADLFVLSAAALAERALLKNDLAAAARWARTAGRLPATIGIPHRYLEYPGYGYWQGAVLARQGKSEEARRVWRRTLEDWEKEHQAVAAYFNNVWGGKFVNPENAFLMGLCALRLGDAALLRRAREQFRQIKQKHGTPFFEGLLAELEGDFKTAAACYKKQIASAPHSSRLARLHLAAVAAGRRRGE
jgi:tetratricopeptide (TPR) repeat protein